MTRRDALKLMDEYCELLRKEGEQDEVLVGLHSRFPKDGSERKAMRWLGFIQGALYSSRRFTLEELKEHSRRQVDGELQLAKAVK